MDKGLAEKIFELREQGLSYRKVEAKLGCSRSLISYHCGAGQKDKTLNRQRKDRKDNTLKTKIKRFRCWPRSHRVKQDCSKRKIEKILQNKIRGFCLTEKVNGRCAKCRTMFKTKDLIERIEANPVCYLTGRKIDLEDGRSYHLDHIIPRSKGGDNSMDNCGLACKSANQAKTDLTLEEFIQLCREVVEKHRPTQK